MSSVHSSQSLSMQTPQSSLNMSFFGSQTTSHKNLSRKVNEKLFCSVTPYSSISQTLQEHIAVKSNGEVIENCSKDSGFSTAVNSLMQSQNDQMSPSPNASITQSMYAKSYAPSPATQFLQTQHSDRGDSNESRYSQSSQYQFGGEKTRSERNLQLYHQEAFKFLMTMNSNLQKIKEAENERKLRKELNLEQSQLDQSYMARQSQRGSGDMTMNQSFQSIQSATPNVYLKKSRAVQEKKNTVQTILASSFCKSEIFCRSQMLNRNRRSTMIKSEVK